MEGVCSFQRRGTVLVIMLLGVAVLVCPAAVAATQEIADSFDNRSGPLHGSTTEGGCQVWQAAGALQVTAGRVTNVAAATDLVATVPVEPGEPDSTFVVEALLDPGSAQSVAIGFTTDPTGPFWDHAEIWLILSPGGQLYGHARGVTYGLYNGSPPSFIANAENRLRLEYWRGDNTVRAWLNQEEVTLAVSDLDVYSFAPNIAFAGFQAHHDAGVPTNGMTADEFRFIRTESLLDDPGFEEDSGSWSTWADPRFPGTSVWRETWGLTAPHDGSSASAISNLAYSDVYSSPVVVSPSTQYHLSAQVKGELNTESGLGSLQINVRLYDAGDTYLGNRNVTSEGALQSGSWQLRSGSFTTPENAAKARVYLSSYLTSGWVAFDDIELVEDGSSSNLLADPGFEETPGDWTTWSHPDLPATSVWRGTWGTAAAEGSVGTGYSYVVSNQAFGCLYADGISVSGETSYDLHAWIKGEIDGDGSFRGPMIRTFFFNGATQLGSEILYNAYGSLSMADWAQLGGRFTTPAGTTTVKVELYNQLAIGWVAFDDVTLVRVGGDGSNLLSDGGFELDDGAWSVWKCPDFPATAVSRFLSWGPVRSGSAAYVIGNLAFGSRSQEADVSGGAEYDLSVWARGEIDADESLYGGDIRVRYYDSSGSDIRTDYLQSWAPQTTTWEQHAFQLQTPADAASLSVELYNLLASGWVAFDDVSLQRLATDPAPPPYVVDQPDSVGTNLGAGASFSAVVAGGSGPLAYQWQHRPHSGGWSEVTGATATTLTISSVTSQDLGDYRLRATDAAGRTATSAEAYLQVPFSVDPLPAETSAEIGSTVTIVCTAVGGAPPYTFQWFSSDEGSVFSPITGNSRITGVATSVLTISNVVADDARFYRCRVSDAGSRQLDSTATELAVMVAVPDPGFEEATSAWTTWSADEFSGTSFWKNTWGTATPHSGALASAISNQAHGELYSVNIGVSPSTEYELSALVRGEIDTEDSFAGLLIRVGFYDSSGDRVGRQDVVNGPTFVSAIWVRRGNTFTTPSNVTQVRIELYNLLSSGWIAFDDVQLVEAGGSTNLAPDPGFEEASGDWIPLANSDFPGTSIWRSNWGPADNSGYAYVISNQAYGMLYTMIPVSPATSYDLYAWVKGEIDADGSLKGLLVQARFYNGTTYLGLVETLYSNHGTLSPTDWVQVGGRFTTPADATSVRVDLYNHLSTGWVAFDDVTLVEAGGDGYNLLSDGGFELDDGSWTRWSYQYFPATAVWRNTWGPIRSGGAAQVIGNLAFGSLNSASIGVDQFTEYDLKVWARGEIDAEDTIHGANVRTKYFDASGHQISEDQFDTWTPQSETWEQLVFRLQTPAGTASMQILLHNLLGSGWVAYDDIELVVVGPYDPPPLTIDPLPGQITTEVGETVSMECTASGGSPSYTYQWQKSADGNSYANLADDPGHRSGTSAATLLVSDLQASDEGYYRCRVSDAGSPPSEVVSNATLLTPLPPVPTGCTPYALPAGDFTSYNGFNLWTADQLDGWSYEESYSRVETQSGYLDPGNPATFGSISRDNVVIPESTEIVRFSFDYVLTQSPDQELSDLGVWLRWGPESYQRVVFMVDEKDQEQQVEVEVGTLPAWHDSTAVDGFYHRTLTLEFATPHSIAHITRIDLLPGPFLNFNGEPRLLTVDGFDPLAEGSTYKAGTQMHLVQLVTNEGCDMQPTHSVEHRMVTYSLCRVDTGECAETGWDCALSYGSEPGSATVQGNLTSDEQELQTLCALTLPSRDPEDLGTWELQGVFDHFPDRVSDPFRFEIVNYGIPNLTVLRDETITASQLVEEQLVEIGKIKTAEPLKISFTVQSQIYPTSGVQVEVQATSSLADGTPVRDLPVVLAEGTLNDLWGPETVTLDIAEINPVLIPAPHNWVLLNVTVVIDPAGNGYPVAIVETEEADNLGAAPGWMPLSTSDLDEIGHPLFNLDFNDPDTGLPDATEFLNWSILDGNLIFNYEHVDPNAVEQPYLAWQRPTNAAISGVMIRYRRPERTGEPWLSAGRREGAHTTAPTSIAGSKTTISTNNQWQTLVWKRNDEEPFSSLGDSVKVLVMEGNPDSSATDHTLYVGVDSSCLPQPYACASTSIDYIMVWGVPTVNSPWDAEPAGLLYRDGSDWRDMPAQVSLDSTWELAVGAIGFAGHTETDAYVDVTMTSSSGTGVQLVAEGGIHLPNGNIIFPLKNEAGLLPTWVADTLGDTTFFVDLTVDDPLELEDAANNSAEYVVGVGCITPLVFPTDLPANQSRR